MLPIRRLARLKYYALLAASCGVIIASAIIVVSCGVGSSNNEQAESANRLCIGHRGVQEIPANSAVVVCKDGIVVAE